MDLVRASKVELCGRLSRRYPGHEKLGTRAIAFPNCFCLSGCLKHFDVQDPFIVILALSIVEVPLKIFEKRFRPFERIILKHIVDKIKTVLKRRI